MSYQNNPELVAGCNFVGKQGKDDCIGDRVCGVAVFQNKNRPFGFIQLDFRDWDGKNTNLVIEMDLPEFIAAISRATLNRDSDL